MKGLIKWKNSRRFYGLFWVAALLFAAIFGCIKIRNSYALADAFVPTGSMGVIKAKFGRNVEGNYTYPHEISATSPQNFITYTTYGSNTSYNGINRLDHLTLVTQNSIKFYPDMKYKISLLFNIQIPVQDYEGRVGLDPTAAMTFASVICPTDQLPNGRNILLDCKTSAISEAIPYGTESTTFSGSTYESTSPIKEYMYQMEIYGTMVLNNNEEYYQTDTIEFSTQNWLAWNSYGSLLRIAILDTKVSYGYEYNEALEIIQQQNEQDQQDRNNVSSTSDQAEGDGDSASSDASGKTTSLAGAASTLISAVTSMHETNCKIPNFSIYGMQFNDMDFCQFPLPSGLSALASVGMVFLMVPFGIKVIKRMLNLYSEILGGK